jgi:NADH:ubiquinone oxidoreductase subunit D
MKYLILTALLAVTATPRLENADPYKKYDLVLDKAQQNIAITKASIDEAKEMTDAKVQEIQESVLEAKEMAKKVELLERVCEVYSVPVPESMEALEAERVADSIRVDNMQKLNEKGN